MEVRLLGPVELAAGDRVVDAGPLRQRAVLAALATDAGRPVMLPTLVDRVWDEQPPAEPRSALYSYVSRLRRLLEAAGPGAEAGGSPTIGLCRRAGGYQLDTDPDRVDLHRFRRLVGGAREAGCADADQVDLLQNALRLWRGAPLAGLPGGWAARMRDGWLREKLDAAARWAGAELRIGRPEEVIGPIRALLDECPLAEQLVEALMRALVAEGRDAEALAYYAAARERLADQLGVEPGPQLRAAHQAILRGELGRPDRRVVSGPAAVPAQLPADVAAFTGRIGELSQLDGLLTGAPPANEPTALVIAVVTGSGGVGKTALAVRWAHRVREAFRDGQLYVNLRGYDCQPPVTPGEVLARFLNALGVTGAEVPPDEDERATRYRTAIAGRRMLIVLDNASSAEQVRPLLPGSASCVVVVTSRDSLGGLVCLHGARRLDLGRLPATDAIGLLCRLLGARVSTDPAAARALASQCAHLPLALRLTADLATARPCMPLAGLVAELADHRRRLDRLDAGGDTRAAIRTVFSWSYEHLPADTARAFRLAGLHPGPDLDAYATAALLGTDLAHSQRLLDSLARTHLIEPTASGRYGMHDLLRAYAAELATTQDGDTARHAALARLYDYYLATSVAAMDVVFPEPRGRPKVALPSTPVLPLPDPATALSWLDMHRPTLNAVCAHTATHGSPLHTTRLAHTLYRYHDNGGHYPDLLTTNTHALHAAREVGDRDAQAHALSSLAIANIRLSRYQRAVEQLTQAFIIFREVGDRYGQARALGNLGAAHRQLGAYGPAADCHQQALALRREIGDRAGEARVLGNLGLIYLHQGRYEPAIELSRQALALHRTIGDRLGEAYTRCNLGRAYAGLGHHILSIDHLRQALARFRELANRDGEAEGLTYLGDVHTAQCRYGPAADHHRRALDIYREIGSRYGQVRALNGLGEARCAAGRRHEALTHHAAALDLAAETGDRDEQVRAHCGLAQAYDAARDRAHAGHHWRAALAVCADPDAPQASGIRDRLAALG